jgi:hypothetical protein
MLPGLVETKKNFDKKPTAGNGCGFFVNIARSRSSQNRKVT